MGDKIFKNRQEIVLTLVLGYYKLALPKTDSGSLAQLVEHFTFNEGSMVRIHREPPFSVFSQVRSHRLGA